MISSRYSQGRARKRQNGEPHFCAGEDQGIDSTGRYVKVQMRWRYDLRQLVWLHQRQIVPSQSGGHLW